MKAIGLASFLLLPACTMKPEEVGGAVLLACESHDISTFEQYVDIEAVILSNVEGCTSAWNTFRRFSNQTMPKEMAATLQSTDSVLAVASIQSRIQTFRGDFQSCSQKWLIEQWGCGLADAEALTPLQADVAGKTAYLWFPVTHSFDQESKLSLRLLQEGRKWRVNAVDYGTFQDDYQAAQEARLQETLDNFKERLNSGIDPGAYSGLASYLENNPYDHELVEYLESKSAEIQAVTTPYVISKQWISRSWMGSDVYVKVRNDSDQAVHDVVVRFHFYDASGSLVTSSYEDAMGGLIQESIGAGSEYKAGWMINDFMWPVPRISSVEAFVVALERQDGTTWLHPAAVAEIWR